MRALLLLLLAAPAAAVPGSGAAQVQWGLRLGGLNTAGGVKKHFGNTVTTLELYAHHQRPDSKLGFEGSISGWGASSRETGFATYNGGASLTTYTFAQDLIVVPIHFTVLYGPKTEKYSLQAGAGAGVHIISLTRRLSFAADDANASFRQAEGLSTAAGGPHAQVNGEYYFNKNFGVALLGRYGWARSDLGLYRGFRSASTTSASFAERDDLGNVAGFSFGGGIALRF